MLVGAVAGDQQQEPTTLLYQQMRCAELLIPRFTIPFPHFATFCIAHGGPKSRLSWHSPNVSPVLRLDVVFLVVLCGIAVFAHEQKWTDMVSVGYANMRFANLAVDSKICFVLEKGLRVAPIHRKTIVTW